MKFLCNCILTPKSYDRRSLMNNYILTGAHAMNTDGNDITQYGVSKGYPKDLSALSACFWMSTPAEYVRKYHPTPLSYKVTGAPNGNTFMLNMQPLLIFYIRGSKHM